MIAGLLDCLEQRYPGSKLLGFRDGPRGIVTKRYSEITVESMVRSRLCSPPFWLSPCRVPAGTCKELTGSAPSATSSRPHPAEQS